jgi:hypothetical protein
VIVNDNVVADLENQVPTTPKTDRELLQEMNARLEQLVGLIAIQGRDRDAQLEILYKLGFDSSSIGTLVGMQASNVRRWKSKKGRSADEEEVDG